MNWPTFVTAIAALLGTIFTLVKMFLDRPATQAGAVQQLAAADEAQAASNLANINATAEAVTVVRQQNKDLRADLDLAKVDMRQAQADLRQAQSDIKQLRKDLDVATSTLDQAYEQADLLNEQLIEERQKVQLLRDQLKVQLADLTATREELAATKLQLEAALRREEILREHARRTDEWWQRHTAEVSHGPDVAPPPALIPFED